MLKRGNHNYTVSAFRRNNDESINRGIPACIAKVRRSLRFRESVSLNHTPAQLLVDIAAPPKFHARQCWQRVDIRRSEGAGAHNGKLYCLPHILEGSVSRVVLTSLGLFDHLEFLDKPFLY